VGENFSSWRTLVGGVHKGYKRERRAHAFDSVPRVNKEGTKGPFRAEMPPHRIHQKKANWFWESRARKRQKERSDGSTRAVGKLKKPLGGVPKNAKKKFSQA